jgi:type IV secretion system protein VirB9
MAEAQTQPMPSGGDAHLQVVNYDAGQIVRLRSSPGYQLMVVLSPDEDIRNVAVGDSSAWQVTASKDGDRLFLKATQGGSVTNMTVVTSVRVYNFNLEAQSQPSLDMPYTVQFHYPAPVATSANGDFVDASAISRRLSRYRISGDRNLRPSAVSDDGQHTYVTWPKNALIPATYAVERSGKEVLVNGMMGADDVFVIDGAPQVLTFRIDGEMAQAVRINVRKAH